MIKSSLVLAVAVFAFAGKSAVAQDGIVTIGLNGKGGQKAAMLVRINDITPVIDKKTQGVTAYEVELQNAGTKEVIGTFNLLPQEYKSTGGKGATYRFHPKDFKQGQEHVVTFVEVTLAGPKGEKIVAKQVTGVYSVTNFTATK